MSSEYQQVKKRVEKGAEFLKDKFLNPEFASKVELYNKLATQMLEYEIENNLLPL